MRKNNGIINVEKDSPNVLCCIDTKASPFWKAVLWALQAAQMGIMWKIGNGELVRFWEDHWFENSSLAIQILASLRD